MTDEAGGDGRAHRLRGARRPRRSRRPTSVAVIGAGTLGLLTIAALRRLRHGRRTIVATAKHPEQRRLATELGADRVVAPGELARAVRAGTGSFARSAASSPAASTWSSTASARRLDRPGPAAWSPPAARSSLVGMPGHTSLDLTALWHRETSLARLLRLRARRLRAPPSASSPTPTSAGSCQRHLPPRRYEEAIEHAANAGRRGAVKIAFDLRGEKHR